MCLYNERMETSSSSRMIVLTERLRSIDRSQSRLTAERLKVLAEIAKLDAEGGASARQTASRVARITSSTPKDAASEVETAKQVAAALPGIADAHARGEITNGQLGALAAIASASSEHEALALARSATSSQLHQRAAASRGKLFEERRKAQTGRYLAFKPEEDGQSTRIHGRLPFAESKELENQLRKIADRLGRCDKERPSPSARMADALLILTKGNPSQALNDHEERAKSQPQPVQSNETQRYSSPNGLPTGLITSAYHSSWRQDRYLAFRDGPCRVPECQSIGKTQAHHIFEDRIDRVTSVQYMINFCNRCHQEHHDGTFAVGGDPEQTTTFTYKDGTVLSSTARPLPIELKPPKPIPLNKHQQQDDANLFATSA